MSPRDRDRLLTAVGGPVLSLDRVAAGYGRVATSAHPLCTCTGYGTAGIRTCPMHPGRSPYENGPRRPRFWAKALTSATIFEDALLS